jgi:hypothetical protein
MNTPPGLVLAAIGIFLVIFATAPLPNFDPMYRVIDAHVGISYIGHLAQGIAGIAFFALGLYRMRR